MRWFVVLGTFLVIAAVLTSVDYYLGISFRGVGLPAEMVHKVVYMVGGFVLNEIREWAMRS